MIIQQNPAISTSDNNYQGVDISRHSDTNLTDLRFLAENTIQDLADKNRENLLVFPHCLNAFHRDIESNDFLFQLRNNKLYTGNYLGFIGRNDTKISISSRFDKDDNNYFIHYMLQKVFAINIFDLNFNKNLDSIWDFLIYLFPFYLKKALHQGLFKKYEKRQYNDARVKGRVDAARHIKNNIPFNGKIAYNTKEYSYDNHLTQLIRHTIEFINSHKLGGRNVLQIDSETKDAVFQIIFATPSFCKNNRSTIIGKNIKSDKHPYFTDYFFLQQLCLKILRRDKLSYGKSEDNVYGLVFDGSWLWEEYLNTIIKHERFIHPQNRENKFAISLFESGKCKRYPDFYKEGIVLDAKYKKLSDSNSEKVDRNDLNQIISYIYVQKATIGGFIHPISSVESVTVVEVGKLNGYGGSLFLIGIPINTRSNFDDFSGMMLTIENELRSKIRSFDCNISSLSS